MPKNAFDGEQDNRFYFEKSWHERAANAARNAFNDTKAYFGLGDSLKEMEDYGYWRDKQRGAYRNQEAKAAPEKTWPSREFWQKYGPSDYDDNNFFVDKLGQVQSFAANAANGVTIGIPLAAARRFAPEIAKPIDDVRRNSGPVPLLAGELAGLAASPANKLVRGLGDAAASRGYGTAVQAGSDALGATAVNAAAPIIEGDPYAMMGLRYSGPAAFASRYAMPTLPPELARRIGIGAAAGVTSQMIPTAIDNNLMNLPAGALAGAMHGGFSRGPKTGQSYKDALEHEGRYSSGLFDALDDRRAAFFRGASNPYSSRVTDIAFPIAGINTALMVPSLGSKDELQQDPRRTPQAAYPRDGY